MSKRGKVLVAMSGGIDSTVAALILHDQGYEVIGITMKTWDYAGSNSTGKETGCCNVDSFNDARLAAVQHGFPHYVLDIREEFGGAVIENFVEEYIAGRTPNPCVLCNTHIKWSALLKKADALDCDYIATGHYVKNRGENGRQIISKARDLSKDQSYVLWGLEQEAIARSIYPLGDMLKTEVRQLAYEMGYEELSKKSESYEICFVPDNDYRGFLNRKLPGLEEKVAGGEFRSTTGALLGHHKGYPYYTVGQRRGLDISFGKPMFVTQIQPDTNTVILGELSDLDQNVMEVGKLNFLKYDHIPANLEASTKIRYRDPGAASLVIPSLHNAAEATVHFLEPVKGIAPGQSAVIYEGDDVVAGGIIMRGTQIL